MFSGRLKITVIEAKGLQLTNVMAIGNRNSIINLNPYVTIDVDKLSIDRTSTKLKTVVPTWNETYSTEFLRNAKEVGFTIFHDATIPPSSFIANCAVQITKLNENGEAIWVSFFSLIIKRPFNVHVLRQVEVVGRGFQKCSFLSTFRVKIVYVEVGRWSKQDQILST